MGWVSNQKQGHTRIIPRQFHFSSSFRCFLALRLTGVSASDARKYKLQAQI